MKLNERGRQNQKSRISPPRNCSICIHGVDCSMCADQLSQQFLHVGTWHGVSSEQFQPSADLTDGQVSEEHASEASLEQFCCGMIVNQQIESTMELLQTQVNKLVGCNMFLFIVRCNSRSFIHLLIHPIVDLFIQNSCVLFCFQFGIKNPAEQDIALAVSECGEESEQRLRGLSSLGSDNLDKKR